MAWRFEPDEPLRRGFCRVACEELGNIRAGLAGSELDRNKAIHEARQGLKRLRALVRLAKPSLGPDYDEQDRRWRDAGRELAGPRDAAVSLETFDKLVAECGSRLPSRSLGRLRAALAASHADADSAATDEKVRNVLGILGKTNGQLEELNWPDDTAELSRSLKQSQARLRKSWKRAHKNDEPEALHEWRKRVKDQSSQLRLFRQVMPDSFDDRRDDAKATAELLGAEHDLWALAGRLSPMELPAGVKKVRALLLDEITARRQALRRQALRCGEDFSSERKGSFARTVVEAWEEARLKAGKSRRKPRSGTAAKSTTSQAP